MERPFSQACENNKDPILGVIGEYLSDVDFVLEVGSGTGQHAVHFAGHLPHITWQCTDRRENLAGIGSWLQWAGLKNTPPALELDVNKPWPVDTSPAIYSANTLHIMSWREVELFFQGVAEVLASGGVLCVYGPFNYGGAYTSDSNRDFDGWLQGRDPLSGIRDFEVVDELARQAGLELETDTAMPANNRCLVWRKR